MNDCIASNPQILGGKPCVKGTRIPVYMVLELVAASIPFHSIPFHEIRAKYYPQLSDEDIRACIAYARQIVQNEEVHFALEQAA
ncbi:DUF433 domain-containing protein [candidate division KSB1 bacterium]|nr:DUF433 domain-containing protein [candidate division KSB1 bacterium]